MSPLSIGLIAGITGGLCFGAGMVVCFLILRKYPRLVPFEKLPVKNFKILKMYVPEIPGTSISHWLLLVLGEKKHPQFIVRVSTLRWADFNQAIKVGTVIRRTDDKFLTV